MAKLCLICNLELKGKQRKFCSRKCIDKDYYNNNKDKVDKTNKKYRLENPDRIKKINKKSFKKFYTEKRERFNELMRLQYHKHKQKNNSRKIAAYYRDEIFGEHNYKCDDCNSNKNLEIHHIDYSWEKKDGQKNNLLLNKSKVKLLCRDCHRRIHNH